MYRGSWLLVALPLLIAALSVARPAPLPRPGLPPTFDRRSAEALAGDLARTHPNRVPGSLGALHAVGWFSDQLRPYGYAPRLERFQAPVPGLGRIPLVNITAVAAGRSPKAIVVMAHRDDGGVGPGANDNASGTAALIELARGYANPPSSPASPVRPAHTIVFLSTDGGVFGGLGAAHFVETSFYRDRVVAVINLDALAGAGPPRLEIAGDRPRSPAGALVETAAARIFDQTGRAPGRTSVLGQLIDLGFPFSLYEHAPFVGRGIPALTLTTAGNRPTERFADSARNLNSARLGQLGRAAQSLLVSLDQGLELAQGTSSYLYVGTRLVRGWAIELALIAMLMPFLAAAVDLFARCRRRGIALRPAFRAYRARLSFWLLAGALFELFALLGAWPKGAARPLDPSSAAATDWPLLGLAGLVVLIGAAWLVAREPLLPRRPATAEEELAGHTAALLALGIVGLLVIATNPFALVFLLPSLHAWLWLPQVRANGRGIGALVLLAGFTGPLLLLGSLAIRFGLGFDAPWYLAELTAVGYVGLTPFAIALAWTAGAAQLAALTVGRYAPYPSRRELPRGPVRQVVRRLILTILRLRAPRRDEVGERRAALEG
jgi:peptidase M28-like protein